MKHLKFLAFTLCAVLMTSCQIVEDTVYPVIDELTVSKNSKEIYARHDVYASDTMCLDTMLVRMARDRMNVSSHYQYIMESPRVAWQKSHMQWICSKSGSGTRSILLFLLEFLALGGFIGGFFLTRWYCAILRKVQSWKEKSADKAVQKGDYEKAERLYEECCRLDLKANGGREIDSLRCRAIPYIMLAMVLIEGAYLFMFNFCVPAISFARTVSPWFCIWNTLLLTLTVISQAMMMYVYAENLDDCHGAEGSKWWGYPIKYLLIIAFAVVLFKNTFVMPLDIISVALGVFCCCYVLKKNTNVDHPEVKVYAVTLILSSYIFMYFLSYLMLIILAYVIIICALMMALKIGDTGISASAAHSEISYRMQQNPGKTYEEVSREYYDEKRREIEERRAQNGNV